MREILFKGKHADNGEWIFGYYVHLPIGRCGEEEHLIQTLEADGRMGILHRVIQETVGQYTGLKDKNGNRIFEGDILELCMDGKVVIEFDEGIFGAHFEEYGLLPLRRSLFGEGGIIIGNIHDNIVKEMVGERE